MFRTVIAGTIGLLAANATPVWLDHKPLTQWNVAGALLPVAPGPKNPDLASGGRCAAGLRSPTQPEDRAVVRKGWSLVGPYQRYGRTSVLIVASSADGMCRPNGYQALVFVNGTFAGTLSPGLMNARSDASISGLGVEIQNERELAATFARYADNDALCCPHASTSVTYTIQMHAGRGLVRATSAQTEANNGR